MTDIEKAKDVFEKGNYSCVLVRGDKIITSTMTGVMPMLSFIDAKMDLKGFSVADKIVGKAAAMLFVVAGIQQVYGKTMSRKAAAVLSENGINSSYGTLIDEIVNRQGTGMCPMEKAVLAVSDPQQAPDVLSRTMMQLHAKSAT